VSGDDSACGLASLGEIAQGAILPLRAAGDLASLPESPQRVILPSGVR
jgi:hypothetical protein